MLSSERVNFRQVREFAEIINVTFSFIRQNFKPLGKVIVFIVGPFILVSSLVGGFMQESMLSMQVNQDFSGLVTSYLISLVMAIVTPAVLATVVYQYIRLYIEGQTDDIDVATVWSATITDLGMMIIAAFVLGVLSFIGFMLCFIPGFYVIGTFALTFIIVVQEREGVFSALARSRELVSGYWWFTFGLIFVFGIILFAITFIFYVPQYIITFSVGLHSMEAAEMGSNTNYLLILSTLVASVVFYLLYAIPVTGLAFQYFNLVERKEAAGLAGEIDQIGDQIA